MFLPIKECMVDYSDFFQIIFLKWVSKFTLWQLLCPDDSTQIVNIMWWGERTHLSTCTSLFLFPVCYHSGSRTVCFLDYCLFHAEPKHQLGFISRLGQKTNVFQLFGTNLFKSSSNYSICVWAKQRKIVTWQSAPSAMSAAQGHCSAVLAVYK